MVLAVVMLCIGPNMLTGFGIIVDTAVMIGSELIANVAYAMEMLTGE